DPRRRRQRDRPHLDPRPQRGAHLCQVDRRLGLRAATLPGGGRGDRARAGALTYAVLLRWPQRPPRARSSRSPNCSWPTWNESSEAGGPPGPPNRTPRRCRLISTLVIAAHTHHSETTPPWLSAARAATTTRLSTPKSCSGL